MTRETRFKYAGILFYTVLVVNLLLSERGWNLIFNEGCSLQLNEAIVALLGTGVALFTSEGIGYVFSTIAFCIWNIWDGGIVLGHGYEIQSKRLSIKLRDKVKESYVRINKTEPPNPGIFSEPDYSLFRQKGGCGFDVFHNFFWQGAPKHILNWAERGNNMLHTGRAVKCAIFIGLSISWIIIWKYQLAPTLRNLIFSLSYIIAMVIIWIVSYNSHKTSIQMLELWLSWVFNDDVHLAMEDIKAKLFLEDNNK